MMCRESKIGTGMKKEKGGEKGGNGGGQRRKGGNGRTAAEGKGTARRHGA